MNTIILTVTHKNFDDSLLPDGYKVIRVGKNQKAFDSQNQEFSDAHGEDNITSENPWYCELTAQYWAWKNLPQADILGLVHYRRYFMDYKKTAACFKDDILSKKTIEEVLNSGKYDIIVPILSAKLKNSSIMYKDRPLEAQDKHWQIIYNIIKEFYPEYMAAFKKVIYGKKQLWYNMFIAKRDVFCAYSEWLFGILKHYDNYIENTLHEQRIPRVDGFLAELLPLVWIKTNIKSGRVKHYDVKNTEDNKLVYEHSAKSMLRKVVYCNPVLLTVMKKLQMEVRIFLNFHIR